MFFIFIQSVITLCIAVAAAGFSVYGLGQTFNGVFIPVVFMGISLEAGKLMAASFLYRYWRSINWLLKSYLSIAVIILVIITSIGIFSFLSKGYQEDTVMLNNNDIKIHQLEAERQALIDQKMEINKYRADAAKAVVGAGKNTKRWMFKSKETAAKQARKDILNIDKQITDIGKELATLQQSQVTTQLHVGPIIYIAKALHKPVDDAVTYLIILLIIVFDPLAVALTISTNLAIQKYIENKNQKKGGTAEIPDIMIDNPEKEIDDLLDDLEHHIPLTEDQLQQKQWLESVIKRKQLVDDIRYNI